jgi:hypothetical protein
VGFFVLFFASFARQLLYSLSLTASAFCSGYFGGRVLLFAQVSMNCYPPILDFLLLLG